MKSGFEPRPIHAYFASVSSSAVALLAFLYGWPVLVAGIASLVAFMLCGVGLGMTAYDIVRFIKGRRQGGDPIDR